MPDAIRCLLVIFLVFPTLKAQDAAQPMLATANLRIGPHSVVAEIADEDSERQAGLMHRTSLPENGGMLFVMPTIGPATFWMKNTPLPLSIAFMEKDGTIVEIHDLEPFSEKIVRSSYPRIAYALEMSQGWFTKKNIWPGERVGGLPAPSTTSSY